MIRTGPTQRTYIEQLVFECDDVGYEISVDEQRADESKQRETALGAKQLALFVATLFFTAGVCSILGFVAVYSGALESMKWRGISYDPTEKTSESTLFFRQLVLLVCGILCLVAGMLLPLTTELYMEGDFVERGKDKARREVA